MRKMKVVFTDLDGTLLDHDSYSYLSAINDIEYLNQHQIPIIFCTSKTRKEIIYWKTKMGNIHPFISENGGGIFIPRDYFPFTFEYTRKTEDFYLIQLGENISILENVFCKIKKKYHVTSFLQMSINELSKIANLHIDQAELALQRDFSIPFILHDTDQYHNLIKEVKKYKLQITKGGRFYHLIGGTDKGKAVQLLTNLYKKNNDTIQTIGIGDSENDLSMLQQVNHAYLVKRKDNTYASQSFDNVTGVGPTGWSQVIKKEFID